MTIEQQFKEVRNRVKETESVWVPVSLTFGERLDLLNIVAYTLIRYNNEENPRLTQCGGMLECL